MTGEELTVALYVEQGYVVASSFRPYKMGEIDTPIESGIPMRVVAFSTQKELMAQWVLAHKIAPELAADPAGPGDVELVPFIYRLEAVD